MEEREFIVTKQIAVKASSPEEAVQKNAEGRTISVNATERPTPPQQGAIRTLPR